MIEFFQEIIGCLILGLFVLFYYIVIFINKIAPIVFVATVCMKCFCVSCRWDWFDVFIAFIICASMFIGSEMLKRWMERK